jgi:hypothetical protein
MVWSVISNFNKALKYRGGVRGLLEHMYTVRDVARPGCPELIRSLYVGLLGVWAGPVQLAFSTMLIVCPFHRLRSIPTFRRMGITLSSLVPTWVATPWAIDTTKIELIIRLVSIVGWNQVRKFTPKGRKN